MLPVASPAAVVAEEFFDPLDVGLFGPNGHMKLSGEIPNLLQQGRLHCLTGLALPEYPERCIIRLLQASS
jgi:hypothetical protein